MARRATQKITSQRHNCTYFNNTPALKAPAWRTLVRAGVEGPDLGSFHERDDLVIARIVQTLKRIAVPSEAKEFGLGEENNCRVPVASVIEVMQMLRAG